MQLGHPVRIAVDGPPWSGLDLGRLVVETLVTSGRQALRIDASDFLRPASLRLERGREDPDGFYDDWVDVNGLRREVLDPCGPHGSRRILPTLWDAATDRATRADYVTVRDDAIVVVDGWLLLGQRLPFDLVAHVALSRAARARRVPPAAAARELPAFDRYDDEARPLDVADIVVRADDPRRPAVMER